jgi:hypothetical protein
VTGVREQREAAGHHRAHDLDHQHARRDREDEGEAAPGVSGWACPCPWLTRAPGVVEACRARGQSATALPVAASRPSAAPSSVMSSGRVSR